MTELWILHQTSLVGFLVVLLIITVGNLWFWRRLDRYGAPKSWSPVSVLIPARNEVGNIGACVSSLLDQHYPQLEVLVLDDQSTDGTSEVVSAIAAKDLRLRALTGKPLPDGWLGKPWACHQLSGFAAYSLLLFTDADTRHDPDALGRAVSALQHERAGLVTVFPRQEVGSWAERLVVPIMQWATSAFLPVGIANRVRARHLVTASGQFMLFDRRAYDKAGGHASVRREVVEDVALARRIHCAGLGWRLLDGTSQVTCRMYRNREQVRDGLGKNLFALFENNTLVFTFVWLWLLTAFWEPLIVIGRAVLTGSAFTRSIHLALAAAGCSLLLWGLAYWRFRFPLYLTLLYPLTILVTVGVAFRSMILTLRGNATWKGRSLGQLSKAKHEPFDVPSSSGVEPLGRETGRPAWSCQGKGGEQ
jgi:chlorobactene glucosyltransferase